MSTDNNTPQSIRHDNGISASWGFPRDGSLISSEEQKVFMHVIYSIMCFFPTTFGYNHRIHFLNPNDQELSGQARAQEQEIIALRQQISQAYIKEMQLLNEKYALERKFSDLRMAMDEKQKESITSALKELMHRKADLEENDAEEQRYIFMTSLVGLLAEFGTWPGIASASSISMNLKHLYDQLHQKLEEKTRLLKNLARDQYNPQPSSVHVHSPYQPTDEEWSTSSHHTVEENAPPTKNGWPVGKDYDIGPSLIYDDGPGIEGFQITGEAIPGGRLLGCGYPVRGTSLCMFQWVRHLQDGTRHYIEGATNPEYVVTADDVDKCIAVECIPMDENGRQGELVRRFANDQKKISCDPDMQAEIDSYIYKGQAAFRVLVLIKIPGGLSAQFVLTCLDGTSHPFRTYNDVR
ncbi:hypothetical protein RDABS01_008537 [Bienertia sinuspersici]